MVTEADDREPNELSGMSGPEFVVLFQGYDAICAVGIFGGCTASDSKEERMETIAIWKHDLSISLYGWGLVKLDSSMSRAKVCGRSGHGTIRDPDRTN